MRKGRKLLASVLAAALIFGIMPGNSMQGHAENDGRVLTGDADGDGSIRMNDAVAVLKHIAGIPQESFAEGAADADGDGRITLEDAIAILKHTAKIIKEFPADCTEHAWDGGKTIKEATLTEEGLVQYACTKCGTTRKETVPVLEACTEHKWDDGKFVDMYLSETNWSAAWHGGWGNGADSSDYAPGWDLETVPPHAASVGERDVLRQFIIFSEQIHDFDMKTQSVTRYCEEGPKEYTCRICGEKKTDFCIKKRPVPEEADAPEWAFGGGYRPTAGGWTGKYCWLEDEELKLNAYYREIEMGLTEGIYSREQEEALDAISAQFVSGNMGLYEYEAAVREYLSGLGIFDTLETKGELLIGITIYFRDNMQRWEPLLPYFHWLQLPDGASTKAHLGLQDFQYVYLNAYGDKEAGHSVNYTIGLYVKNPLLKK